MGRAREVLAADHLGDLGQVLTGAADPAQADTDLSMQYVVVFDMWHLNMWFELFQHRVPIRTLQFSFRAVREMLEKRFRPGDRVLLASFGGQSEARIHTPWLEDRAAALQALDDLEVDPTLGHGYRVHAHHSSWSEAWKTLLEVGDSGDLFKEVEKCPISNRSPRVFIPSVRAW